MRCICTRILRLLFVLAILLAGCPGDVGPGLDDLGVVGDSTIGDGARDRGAPSPDLFDAGSGDGLISPDATPLPPPKSVAPCSKGKCWPAPALGSACGSSTVNEDYSTGRYNVHKYPLTAPKGVALDLVAKVTGGSWNPALIIHDSANTTVYDGERGISTPTLTITPVKSGRNTGTASLRLTAKTAQPLTVFVTSWSVVDQGFTPLLPATAKYGLTVTANCKPPPPGTLLSPPNFDPNNKSKGYYLLPPSQPKGLYTRKADGCSRGNKLLIDVLYTVAKNWNQKRPSLSPIAILDLNEGPCSSVNHATHDDGTHADITAGCATQVSCTDNQPRHRARQALRRHRSGLRHPQQRHRRANAG